jgi:hypothetical protein
VTSAAKAACATPLINGANNMNTIPDFHDGYFDGLWISGQKKVHMFLRTVDKKPFTLVLHAVKLLKASNVRQGNIILELALVDTQQITAAHIADLYEFARGRPEESIEKFLSSARNERLNVLEMSSSYGAECIALFHRGELRDNHICSE